MRKFRSIDIALLVILLVTLYTSFIDVSREFRIVVALGLFVIYLLTWMGDRKDGQ
mgnify:CR=1 FL=1